MEEEWTLIITHADNGFVLKGRFGNSETSSGMVVEEDEDADGELECVQRMLVAVKEYFGCYYSKHNKKNIVIEVVERPSVIAG